jgi:CPA2 family monovalent cation:H+ antiporter-2
VVALYALVRWIIAPVARRALSPSNREFPPVLAVTVLLGCTGMAHWMGLSPALGAFAAGVILGDQIFADQIRADIAPLRAVFVTLFFTSIGMLAALPKADLLWMLPLGVAAVIVLNTAIVTLVGLLLRRPLRIALQAGFVLSQIGEFSFVLSETAFEANILQQQVYYFLVAVSVATLFLSPYLIALSPGLADWISKRLGAQGVQGVRKEAGEGHVVVIGYGPAGQSVVQSLLDRGTAVTVIDLNPSNLQDRPGLRMQFGDAASPEILEHAGITSAVALVVTIPDPAGARLIIATARTLAPDIPILVRARYHLYAEDLKAAGATECADEEAEIGHLLAGMTEGALKPKVT